MVLALAGDSTITNDLAMLYYQFSDLLLWRMIFKTQTAVVFVFEISYKKPKSQFIIMRI